MSFSGMGGSDWRSFYTRDIAFVDGCLGVVKDTVDGGSDCSRS